jgi:3-hydroxyacyl-CoA dehydrogenase
MYKPKPEESPVMKRLEEGIETLKQMKQPGMDLTTGLTRTSVRKILDRAGIQVPDKVDPIEVFEKNFGGDALMDVKDVAEEMIELERMGKSTKKYG